MDSLNFQLTITALVLIAFWHFLRKKSRVLDNISGPPSPSWFKGNYEQVFNPDAWGFHEFLAKEYGSMTRLHGPYGTNTLYTFDPKAMQTVLVKDQDVFEEDDGFIKGNLLIFGEGLLGTLGHRHRKQRKMLNPVFSAAHMREMIPVFFEVTHKLEAALENQLQAGSSTQEVEILSWMGRTALELMGQAGLGYSFDPLTDEESAHPYSQVIKELLPTLIRLQFWQFNVLPYVSWIGTADFRRRIVNMLPWKDLHHMRDMVDYMHSVAEQIYKIKLRAFEAGDEAVASQIGRGNDLISILMKENMDASEEDRLGDTEVIAQVSISSTLIFAAMDTTSSAMARLLHLLSGHPEAQNKLRQELIEAKRAKDGQDFSYEELTALPFLDAVCRETLRLYTPASAVTRRARQDAIIPLLKPVIGLDGSEIHEVAVPNDTAIIVSLSNSNRNSDLWGEDADEWKPERWLSPLPKALLEARIPGVYSHLMTFLGGGRSCIGFKFSQLEMKVVISTLVEKFQFSPSSKDSEIFWQMNGVTAPVIGKDNHPQLPMNINLVS
ncbi:cytochrome P450 [Lentinula lateritia]|uniref:Cytochrome P450 n=1 Tax=Lentinula aff. lateritia TaxID=2804960 RepID=A0ACC1TM75_9AGAR|nr:cytochrome P450 [Lentinula aff. lateritia]KAJ3849945.1 cytochrome P450 [Lentinula lateritia]